MSLPKNSHFKFETPFGEGKTYLQSIHGEERISGLFHYTLEILSEERSLDFKTIVGKDVTVTINLSATEKVYRCGVVGRFIQAGSDERYTTYFAEIHPWLWLLTMNSDCRIFQSKSVPEIIKAVFSDLGFAQKVSDKLTGSYSPREYCVQYMENSFDFVSRLMEEEGIFYFFSHDASGHKMVLADDASAYTSCTGVSSISMRSVLGTWLEEHVLRECRIEEEVVVGKYKTTDYNFETPSTGLLGTADGTDPKPAMYEYPGGHATQADGQSLAGKVLLSLEAQARVMRGGGKCRAFLAGAKFKLENHLRKDANTDWVLHSISWRAEEEDVYTNTFEALPAATKFHPPRVTRKPRIAGVQTATVTGKSGEEIFTDSYGRVKVQFHWDQVGKKDENTSCWIRVSQTWAGKQWGSFFLPRVGQEVVVTFLEGNPDRPLVTGSVYNATQTVPYGLPGEMTKSTIKSNSSKGGGGFNELRFEDKKGSEEVFLQAQKDMNVVVLNDQTYTITKNRTATIKEENESLVVEKGDRSIKVNTGKETHEVKGTRAVTVTGNETHTNKANYDGDVTGNFTLKVKGNISIEASGSVTIKAGTSFTNQAGTGLTNKAGTDLLNQAGTSLTNKAGTTMENNAGISLTNKAAATQTVDGGGMLIVKGGLVKIN